MCGDMQRVFNRDLQTFQINAGLLYPFYQPLLSRLRGYKCFGAWPKNYSLF